MLAPLVVLAGLSIVGGHHPAPAVEWLPDALTHRLEHWLEPVVEFGEARHRRHVGRRQQVRSSCSIATVVAVAGIVAAWLVYQRGASRPIEPAILANGWYYDRAVTDFMGGPGRESFEAAAWFDANVVDGAVNGAGRAVRGVAGELRKGQSGYVRAYAGIIGIGVVLLLGWFVVVRGIL